MSGPDISNRAFVMNPKVGDSNPPQVDKFFVSNLGQDIFCLKNLWHFHENIRSCIENECCCGLTVNISMLTLLQIYLYHKNQYSKT